MTTDHVIDIAIIGAGAGGLAAGIFAGEAALESAARPRIVLLDGAAMVGAKILVAGGGRCNVTHEKVTPDDYSGGTKTQIRSVLKAFNERRTCQWMASMGVELKLEDTGKYFPVSNTARTVLDGLLRRLDEVGATLVPSARVLKLARTDNGFTITTSHPEFPTVHARRVIMATGGRALPKSGSDGWGLDAARALGHSIVPTTPALVPLLVDEAATINETNLRELQGVTINAAATVVLDNGKRLAGETHSLLFTHFGISGPGPMDLSRHWLRYRLDHPDAPGAVGFAIGHPDLATFESAHQWLLDQSSANPKRDVLTALRELWPERLARMIAGDATRRLADLTKVQRKRIAHQLTRLPIPVNGDRGYKHAETTAGGVTLSEVDVSTMESRVVPGLHLCGEILDVDGRIGGFSFQWAWATGHLAGRAAVRALER